MEFTRKKVKGQQQKTCKEWRDETDQYRIVWRNEVFGVQVLPGYRAMVRCRRSQTDRFEYWGFAGKIGGLYKTLNRAKEVCEKNIKLWDKMQTACEERKGRADRIRALEEKILSTDGFRLRRDLPLWVLRSTESHVLRLLYPLGRKKTEDESDDSLTEDSTTSSEVSEAQGIPALNVPEAAELETNQSASSGESIPSELAETATAPVKVRKKRAKQLTP